MPFYVLGYSYCLYVSHAFVLLILRLLSQRKIFGFIFRKIKGIWLPYVKYSVLFLLLHNVMYSLNIYNSNYGFKGQTSSIYSHGDVLNHLSEILMRMQGQEQLLGGYWFLRALFFGSLMAFFMIFFVAMISKILKFSYSCCILCGGGNSHCRLLNVELF